MRTSLIILLLLAGCVTTGPLATDAEMDQANRALLTCFKKAAVKLDDGISGAATVGRAVNSSCYREAEQRINLAIKGRNRRVAAMVAEGLRKDHPVLAAEIVLKSRSK